MKIENFNVQMASVSTACTVDVSAKKSSSEKFTLKSPQSNNDALEKKGTLPFFENNVGYSKVATDVSNYIPESFTKFQNRLFKQIIEMMRDFIQGKNHKKLSKSDYLSADQSDLGKYNVVVQKKSVSFSAIHAEFESVSYSTKGCVKTSDGRTIDFGLDFELSRSFCQKLDYKYSEDSVLVMKDPLIINMDIPTAAVKSQKFLFDIDADGTKEAISIPASGSGFLALDKNGNGIIDDGNELFGSSTGNGFEELSKYDIDNNGWIDENDDIFSKLVVFTKDINGNDIMTSLKDADVGAIFLGNVGTGFNLNEESDNSTLARVQSTGIFLHESDGRAGTIQHVDMAV